jgi:hypothetical protein
VYQFPPFYKRLFLRWKKAFYGKFSATSQPREVAEWSIAAVLKTVEG